MAGAIIDLAEDEVALGELYDIFNALDTNHEGKVRALAAPPSRSAGLSACLSCRLARLQRQARLATFARLSRWRRAVVGSHPHTHRQIHLLALEPAAEGRPRPHPPPLAAVPSASQVSRAAWVQAIGQNKLYKSKLCQYFGGATDSDIMAGFNRIDLDRSGYLDWEEFITCARPVAAGLVTAGLVTAGLVTAGLVTDGLVTDGLVTDGLVTARPLDWEARLA